MYQKELICSGHPRSIHWLNIVVKQMIPILETVCTVKSESNYVKILIKHVRASRPWYLFYLSTYATLPLSTYLGLVDKLNSLIKSVIIQISTLIIFHCAPCCCFMCVQCFSKQYPGHHFSLDKINPNQTAPRSPLNLS